MMTQEDQVNKMEKFSAETTVRFCEELEDDNWALRAFGVLLDSSDMNHFSEDFGDNAEMYRRGLRNIVELYLGRQEQKLNELRSKSLNSPERLIHQAEEMCIMTRNGCWASPEVALEKTQKHIQLMSQVLASFGAEECPKAQKVLDDLLDLQDGINSRIEAQRTAKVAENIDYKLRRTAAARQRDSEV